MYKILIVDDEKIERDGIKHLIKLFNLPLEIAEAENGEVALAYLEAHPVDILFTDIKMPFMNGLDLARQAKKLHPRLKTIIFSAFGEFDYAQKAIQSSVMSYILKPIDVDEFNELMLKVIQACYETVQEEEESNKLMSGYLKGLEYEKTKLLLDLINGTRVDDGFVDRLQAYHVDFNEGYIVLMLMDVNKRFFDSHNDEFELHLKTMVSYEYEYLNLNEHQSMMMLKGFVDQPAVEQLERLGQQILQWVSEQFGLKPVLIFSNAVNQLEEIYHAYASMEQMLDLKFFYEENVVLFTFEATASYSESTSTNDKMLKDIFTAIASGDSKYAIESIERLFELFRVNARLSPIYVKFICADILKKVYEKLEKTDRADFIVNLETIFTNSHVMQLKDEVIQIVSAIGKNNIDVHEDGQKKVIDRVIELIKKEYKHDISLEYIADKVYLTPSYLSYLFKKEVDQSLVKYITSFRLKKAKELLNNTNMKIIDICEEVGYANFSYFCMIFKNNFGVSPAKYREDGEAE